MSPRVSRDVLAFRHLYYPRRGHLPGGHGLHVTVRTRVRLSISPTRLQGCASLPPLLLSTEEAIFPLAVSRTTSLSYTTAP